MTDEPDAHSTSAEIAVAATPEQVWEAITTASGSAAWSFRADVEPRQGGAVRIHRGPFGPDASATVTEWDPPNRLAYVERAEPPQPVIATEFLIQARERGSCVVRVVNTFHADGEGWDHIAEEAGAGWRMSLLLLRSYVSHFPGMSAARLDLTEPVRAPASARTEIGSLVKSSLGLGGLSDGALFHTPANAPQAQGIVEHIGPYFVLLRTKRPTTGLFAVSSFPMDAVTVSINVAGRLYGADADTIAAREQPEWHEWLARLVAEIEH